MIEERVPSVGRLPLLSSFIETKQYHRLVEVCEVCQQDRMIGVCYGDAEVGKTLSARRVTQWDQVERLLSSEVETLLELRTLKVALYTPEPLLSAKRLEQEILQLHVRMQLLSFSNWPSSLTPAFLHTQGVPRGVLRVAPLEWDLLVIDEADRLKLLGLEVLRDFYDRSHMGLMFIGMPGIEKRLARYPQFYEAQWDLSITFVP